MMKIIKQGKLGAPAAPECQTHSDITQLLLMECNVSINFLLAIRQNYSLAALAFCLIEIRV